MSAGRILRLACLLALLAIAPESHAQIQERRLRDEDGVLRSPPADLTQELGRIRPTAKRRPYAAALPAEGESAWDQSLRVDVDELAEVLKRDGIDDDDRRKVGGYSNARRQIKTYAEMAGSQWLSDRKAAGAPPSAAVPEGLPEEFALYLTAAVAFHNGDFDAARDNWLRLLELPPEQRLHRSVWAAYMLGRCPPENVNVKDWSIGWYEWCRELAVDAYRADQPNQFGLRRAVNTDRLGLAAASYGWEAKLHLDAGDDVAAVELYLAQLRCGDKRVADSLASIAEAILRAGKPRIDAASESPAVTAVIAIFVGAHGGPHRAAPARADVLAWLQTVNWRRDTLAAYAPLMAWAAYAAGDNVSADLWLDRHTVQHRSDALAEALRAKRAIQKGDLAAAQAHLLKAAGRATWSPVGARPKWDCTSALEGTRRWPGFDFAEQCLAEAGVVAMTRQRYDEALDCFDHAAYVDGVAYVAERAMTPEELQRMVDAGTYDRPPQFRYSSGPRLRLILARRLVRLGRWDDARPYFSRELQTRIDRLRDALRRGQDAEAYREDRAAALWEAAQLAEQHGYELISRDTAVDPHWRSPRNWRKLAATPNEELNFVKFELQEMQFVSPTHISITSNTRVAADLAWRAAELLPDEDDQTARILNTAGRWYGPSNNMDADVFYKALVRRCATTKLGREADRRGWFVP